MHTKTRVGWLFKKKKGGIMNIYGKYFLIYMGITLVPVHRPIVCMDRESTVGSTVNGVEDSMIIVLMRWRQINKALRDQLTYEYMAEVSGLRITAETHEEIEPYFRRAVREQKKGMVGLLCRLYPPMSKNSGVIEIFNSFSVITQKAHWLTILLKLGADPDSKIGSEGVQYYSMLKYITCYAALEESVCQQCLNVLLQYDVDTREKGLLEMVAKHGHLSVVAQLLEQPLAKDTDMTDVLQAICGRFLNDEQLVPLAKQLVKKGAKVDKPLREKVKKSSNVELQALLVPTCGVM
jgi:hypothetical protein